MVAHQDGPALAALRCETKIILNLPVPFRHGMRNCICQSMVVEERLETLYRIPESTGG
jgi:hypothetical protein